MENDNGFLSPPYASAPVSRMSENGALLPALAAESLLLMDKSHSFFRRMAFVSLCLCWLLSIPLACMFGPVDYSASQVLSALADALGFLHHSPPDDSLRLVVGEIRFSRTIIALLAGGGLALAGVAMQGVLRNPLADPFLLGVSSGAALGAGVVLTLGTGIIGGFGTAQGAMLGAFAALSLALLLGRADKGTATGRDRLVLAGVAVSTMFGAGVSLLKALDEESGSGIVFWILGSFQGRGWADLPLVLIPSLLGIALLLPCWRALDLMSLGEEDAAHLGVNISKTRLLALAGAGLLTAGSVSVSGIIGFVGLVAPHILRRLIGQWHGPLMFTGWLAGGVFLLWADVAARCILPDGLELPVGVITSLVGGPFFALVLSSERRGRK